MNTKQAHPTPFIPGRDTCDDQPAQEGMSLREWYAGLAMQAMITSEKWSDFLLKRSPEHPAGVVISVNAFEVADFMMKESQKNKNNETRD